MQVQEKMRSKVTIKNIKTKSEKHKDSTKHFSNCSKMSDMSIDTIDETIPIGDHNQVY